MSKNVPHHFSKIENELLQTVAQEMQKTIQGTKSVEGKISDVNQMIYKLLTRRPGFQKMQGENPNFLMDNYANLRPYREYYQKHMEELEKKASDIG